MRYEIAAAALMVAAALTVVPTATHAQFIANSPHDLSSGTPLPGSDNDEVCVYCHTPHGGAGASAGVPLWNRLIPTGPYTLYDTINSSTMDGEILTGSPGGVSLACLSCHDGSQANDVVINQPGTNGFNTSGAAMGSASAFPASSIVNLGTDLSNDHPIAVVYGGFDPGGGVIDPEFETAALTVITGTPNKWYLDLNSNSVREKTDIILYTRDTVTTGGGIPAPFVECGSCHDPHAGAVGESSTNADGSIMSFMRVDNVGSDLCLTCHIK